MPWEQNPRQIKEPNAARLAQSFDRFSQVEPIIIGPNNEIYNGHQRYHVLLEKYGEDYEVDVRQASRSLTEKERQMLTVFLHKGTTGEWDFDTLANTFDADDLQDWGFSAHELDLVASDLDVLDGGYHQREKDSSRRAVPHHCAIVSIGRLVGYISRDYVADVVAEIRRVYPDDDDNNVVANLLDDLMIFLKSR